MYSLSNKASTDLDSILDYSIINLGADVMLKYHESMEKCFETLDQNPDLGREIEHIRSDYLCFEHRSHLVFYKKISKDILIIRILHKSMDAPEHFNGTDKLTIDNVSISMQYPKHSLCSWGKLSGF